MNRRAFARTLAGAALGATALPYATATQSQTPAPAASPAPFNLSVMLWTVFTKLPIEQRLENVAAAGYQHVQLTGEFRRWSDADWQNVNQAKQRLGITFDATSGINASLADPSQKNRFLAAFQAFLPTMDRLECPSVIIVPGNVVPGMPRYMQYQHIVDTLKQMAEMVDGKNYKILIENIDPKENKNIYMSSVAEGIEIIRTVNHPQVRLLCDFYHEQIAEGDLLSKLDNGGIDQIGLFHIADVPGRHEPGTGEINYQNIFKRINELHYDRWVAMEYYPTYDEVQSLTAAKKFAYASAALAGQPDTPNT